MLRLLGAPDPGWSRTSLHPHPPAVCHRRISRDFCSGIVTKHCMKHGYQDQKSASESIIAIRVRVLPVASSRCGGGSTCCAAIAVGGRDPGCKLCAAKGICCAATRADGICS